jgi:hypothetical protein
MIIWQEFKNWLRLSKQNFVCEEISVCDNIFSSLELSDTVKKRHQLLCLGLLGGWLL